MFHHERSETLLRAIQDRLLAELQTVGTNVRVAAGMHVAVSRQGGSSALPHLGGDEGGPGEDPGGWTGNTASHRPSMIRCPTGGEHPAKNIPPCLPNPTCSKSHGS